MFGPPKSTALAPALTHKHTCIQCSDGGSISKVGGPKPITRFYSSTTRAGNGVARNLKKEGGIISTYIFQRIFFGRTNLELIKKQEKF